MTQFSGTNSPRNPVIPHIPIVDSADCKVPYEYISMALEILAEYGRDIEENPRLHLTVHLGLRATQAYWDSAYDTPTVEELDSFFADFVLRSVKRRRIPEAA